MKRLKIRLLAILLVLSLLPLPLSAALTPEQALGLLEEYYIDEIPDEVRNASTVEEMMAALGDRYSEYMTAEEYQAFMDAMNDTSLVGIGISMRMEAEGARILTVYPNTPASEAGLQNGDLITYVDGVNMAGVEDASQYLAGAAGTRVSLTVRRNANYVMHLTLTRRQVELAQTLGALVDGHIGFITCNSFSDTTAQHFTNILTQYEDNANVWVVDLRQNGGGLTQGAVDSAAQFIGNSIMAYFKDSEGNTSISIPAPVDKPLTSKPAILLVGGNTASAAELFSGAMRDYGRAIIIGSRTYGKGVAQVLLNHDSHPDLFADGDALKITAYRFYAPYCATNDRLGVIPTLLVDDQYAQSVALLLSAKKPADSAGNFRLDLCGMTFFIDGETAVSLEYIDAFRELLYAIPPAATFYRGTGGAAWTTVSTEDTAYLETGSLTPRTFSDVQSSPYRSAIQTLAIYGIAEPVADDMFQPESYLARGDLCLMIARMLDYSATGRKSFPDVPQGTELSDAVATLYSLGIIEGYGDGYFRPERVVSHQEFLTILARTASCMELNADYYYNLPNDQLPLNNTALYSYGVWARKGVWLDSYLGILWDDLSSISPTASTTKEEAAASLYALLRFCGLVPLTD